MSRQLILGAGLLCTILAGCAGVPGDTASQPPSGEHWVASWGSAQLVPEGENELPAAQWNDASLRQVVRVSLAGRRLRVRLSNVFGTAPLVVDAGSVARALQPGRADVDAASSTAPVPTPLTNSRRDIVSRIMPFSSDARRWSARSTRPTRPAAAGCR